MFSYCQNLFVYFLLNQKKTKKTKQDITSSCFKRRAFLPDIHMQNNEYPQFLLENRDDQSWFCYTQMQQGQKWKVPEADFPWRQYIKLYFFPGGSKKNYNEQVHKLDIIIFG